MRPTPPRRRLALAACLALALPAAAGALRLAFTDGTPGPRQPVFVTVTAVDGGGRILRLDAQGRFHPCVPADNTVPMGGLAWCDYAFPVPGALDLDPGQDLRGGRIYLSAGAPLRLRVDPVTGGLVQPDPANPEDPNRDIAFDWVEFALDASGVIANTTCVDQFGLPITLEARGLGGPAGPRVGLEASRAELARAWLATVPEAFLGLAGPLRITAPGHATRGPLLTHLDGYIREMWDRYRDEPLVLDLPQGTFTGLVEPGGSLVFTRAGDPLRHRITAMPTTPEAFRCDGPLARGSAVERALGAQVAALINRHLLESPARWREAALYYGAAPANAYARFWHEHGLEGRAYGFPYDDVNGQDTLVQAPAPAELRIVFRTD